MRLVDQSPDAIMEMTGHPSPELGGSAAALIAAHIGLSMIRMALAVSASREGEAAGAGPLDDIAGFAARLAEAADRDRSTFRRYLEAVKQPEGEERKAGLRAAQEETLEELLASAELLAEALEFCVQREAGVKADVKSDLFGGAALLHAGFSGVSLALQVNLSRGGAAGAKERTAERLDALDARRKKAYGLISKKAGESGFSL